MKTTNDADIYSHLTAAEKSRILELGAIKQSGKGKLSDEELIEYYELLNKARYLH